MHLLSVGKFSLHLSASIVTKLVKSLSSPAGASCQSKKTIRESCTETQQIFNITIAQFAFFCEYYPAVTDSINKLKLSTSLHTKIQDMENVNENASDLGTPPSLL